MNSVIYKIGFISFLADISSEMLYPIAPIFLTTVIGVSMSSIGWIEGFADFSASILKLYFGRLSDRKAQRKPFVWLGYLVSTLSKGAMGLAVSPWGVFVARAMDRVGKGVRTAPRDALIVEMVEPKKRALAFGIHRGMDTVGAVLGPLVALFLLDQWGEGHLRSFFFLAIIPGLFAVLVSFSLPESPKVKAETPSIPSSEVKKLPRGFYQFLAAWGLFCIGNSSDAFLLLKAKEMGYSIRETILFYCFFNVVYAASSPVLGHWADRFGKGKILKMSLLVFALVYFGFAQSWSPWVLFGAYGVFMGMSEGIGKAKIADFAKGATAQGMFGAVTGALALFSSVIAGLLWEHVGVAAPFIFGGICALLSLVVFILLEWYPKPIVR